MVSYIPWVRIPVDSNWVLYSGSQKLKPRCQPAECSSGVLTGEIYVSLCWQNSFPCGRRPGSRLPCWLSARVTFINSCLQTARWPPVSQQQIISFMSGPSCTSNLPNSLLLPARENYFQRDPETRSASLKYYLYFYSQFIWDLVLEKTLDSPLEVKEVHPKGNQPWMFIGRTVTEVEAPILWLHDYDEMTDWKRPWCWERLKIGGEGGDKKMKWLDGITNLLDMNLNKPWEIVEDRRASWGCKELDKT